MTAYERAMRFLAGHGELIAQSWFDYEGFLDELAAEIRAAVDEEREGCLKVFHFLDSLGDIRCDFCGTLWDEVHEDCFVTAIRARGDK